MLLAYVFLVGPDGFQTMARADTQYSQLSTLAWGKGNTIIEYQYDDNGSLTSKTTKSDPATIVERVEYVYNLRNRLSRVETYDDTQTLISTVEYRYNPQGIRIAKVVDDAIYTDYLIDPYSHTGYAQVLEETAFDISGATPAPLSRIQYTIGDDVISQTRSTWTGSAWTANPTQYLLYDGHGSTRQLAGPTQAIVESYSYDAYGVMLGDSANPNPAQTASTSLLYCGEQYDSNLNQYYLRARYNNPNNGVFNRVDPFAGNLHDPQSLHKYLYCHANPINGIDPSGNWYLITAVTVIFAITVFGMVWLANRPKALQRRDYGIYIGPDASRQFGSLLKRWGDKAANNRSVDFMKSNARYMGITFYDSPSRINTYFGLNQTFNSGEVQSVIIFGEVVPSDVIGNVLYGFAGRISTTMTLNALQTLSEIGEVTSNKGRKIDDSEDKAAIEFGYKLANEFINSNGIGINWNELNYGVLEARWKSYYRLNDMTKKTNKLKPHFPEIVITQYQRDKAP